MSKKPKKRKLEPLGFGILKKPKAKAEVKEPSFNELFKQTMNGIKKLEEDHSEEYWAKAAKVKYAPLLFPLRKSEQMEFWNKKMVEKGLRKTDAGSPFKYGRPIQSEVESIYRSLLEEKLQLCVRVWVKESTKLKDISEEEKLLIDLPYFGTSTWKKWLPLFLSRFMKKYDGQPEQHSPLYLDVNTSVEGQKLPDPLPSDSLYREAIKNSFKQKVMSYANQPRELRT